MSKVQGPGMIFHSENLDIHHKGSAVKPLNTISKASQKKVGGGLSQQASQKKAGRGLGPRKALKDISNSSSLHQEPSTSLRQETSTKKKSHIKEEFNVAEEGFLHDHEKCIRVQQASMDPYGVLGLLSPNSPPKPKQMQDCLASPPRYLELEPIPELEIPARTDWCFSPINSPTHSPFRYELPELVLKPYIDE